MAVERIEGYRQQNGDDILKVILKPTQTFPRGYFYCDASDEKLVRQYTWGLHSQKQTYIVVNIWSPYNHQMLYFHQELVYNKRSYHPDYINHINGIRYDNVNMNLDKVTNTQINWCKPSKGYSITGRSFLPRIRINSQQILAKRVRTEVEAIQSVYQLEATYEDYRYDFLKDRRKDIDILDLERIGKISEEEAVYRHVIRHAADNAWYYYRYNLADYLKDNHLKVSDYAINDEGYMISTLTGARLCPL